MKKFMSGFKAFALKGNVIDMAVGVVVGGAFGKIVSSLVSDIIMPLVGILTGGVNVSGAFYALDGQMYSSMEAAQTAGVATLNYGIFMQNIIDFVLIALSIFVVIKFLGRFKKAEVEKPTVAPRLCAYCKSEIAQEATRCPHCTSQL